jgi:purine-nucleoside phosphorylase
MEAAGLFAVTTVRGSRAAAAFVVSDSLAELECKPDFNHSEFHVTMRTLFNATVNAMTASRTPTAE